jgi:hypothetical protein
MNVHQHYLPHKPLYEKPKVKAATKKTKKKAE